MVNHFPVSVDHPQKKSPLNALTAALVDDLSRAETLVGQPEHCFDSAKFELDSKEKFENSQIILVP